MDLPLVFEQSFKIGKVCNLKGSSLWAEASPRARFDHFTKSSRSHYVLQTFW